METPTVTKEMFIEALLNDFTNNTPPGSSIDLIFKNCLSTINICMAVSKIDGEKWNEIFSKRKEKSNGESK